MARWGIRAVLVTAVVLYSIPSVQAQDSVTLTGDLTIGAGKVHQFTADGSYNGMIGREGRGPGEYVRPWSTALFRDRLFVWDFALKRMQIYAVPSGEVQGFFTLEFPQ